MAEVYDIYTKRKFNHVVGERFGKILVSSYHGKDKNGKRLWNVVCDCGKIKTMDASKFLKGYEAQSCGCERIKLVKRILTKHGLSRTPEYRTWAGMIQRCTNRKTSGYKNYGGRGIKVCERWRESFENFYEDMGKRPDGMSIDRFPNNNGDYEPGNCRWATKKQQDRNKRSNVLVEIQGDTKPLIDWCEILAADYHRAVCRILAGWEPLRAITAERTNAADNLGDYAKKKSKSNHHGVTV